MLTKLELLSSLAEACAIIITLLQRFPNADIIFQADYSTWASTLRFAQTRSYLYADGDSIQGHFAQTSQAWLEFGKALGFAKRMSQELKLVCANPRCTMPKITESLLKCGAGKNTLYYSSSFQTGLVYFSKAHLSDLMTRSVSIDTGH